MSNNFQDIDRIRPQSLAYIECWLKLQKAREDQLVPFGSLAPGAPFVLPGGQCRQVKLDYRGGDCGLAMGGGYVMIYWPWEMVMPV